MLGPLEYGVWILSVILEAGVVACALSKGCFRRYLALNLYMLVSCASSLAGYRVLSIYGFSSNEYAHFYYYSHLLLTIALYFVLINLYSHVFDEMRADRVLRFGAVLLLLGTSIFSFAVVHEAEDRILTRFVVEVSQNLYFVGVVLTYVLWGAMLKLRETRTRLIQLVLSLGVYFSLLAANYALRNLYLPLHTVMIYMLQFIGCLLPLAWCYAFLRFPEEARLAPSRLAVIPR